MKLYLSNRIWKLFRVQVMVIVSSGLWVRVWWETLSVIKSTENLQRGFWLSIRKSTSSCLHLIQIEWTTSSGCKKMAHGAVSWNLQFWANYFKLSLKSTFPTGTSWKSTVQRLILMMMMATRLMLNFQMVRSIHTNFHTTTKCTSTTCSQKKSKNFLRSLKRSNSTCGLTVRLNRLQQKSQ